MLKKTEKGYYHLEKFANQKEIIHGFSTKKLGNMSEDKNVDIFLKLFGKNTNDLIIMKQVHGKQIKVVSEKDKGKVLAGIDGMVCDLPGIVLGVKVADCLPLLFFDPKRKIIGIAHAGWKGTLKKIGQSMVKKIKSLGSKPKNILVGTGPHIGRCCYTISVKRADKFEKEFGDLKGMFAQDGGEVHLDLAIPTVVQLIKVGMQKENIDLGSNCTACQGDEFFSFRREDGRNGSMLGIISLL